MGSGRYEQADFGRIDAPSARGGAFWRPGNIRTAEIGLALSWGILTRFYAHNINTHHMKPHQERVVTEKQELDAKLEKLAAFIIGDIFPTLPDAEQSQLQRQRNAMEDYSEILGERITAFLDTE